MNSKNFLEKTYDDYTNKKQFKLFFHNSIGLNISK